MDCLEDFDPASGSPLFHEPTKSDQPEDKGGMISRIFRGLASGRREAEQQHRQKVTALQQGAALLTGELARIKSELIGGDWAELYPMAPEVIDPLLREIARIQRGLIGDKELEAYRVWAGKARRWQDLYSKRNDSDELKAALSAHIVDKSKKLIDRDVQFIRDYLEETSQGCLLMKADLLAAVAPHIEALHGLKTPPAGECPQCLHQWKALLGDSRADPFNCALKVIENKSQE